MAGGDLQASRQAGREWRRSAALAAGQAVGVQLHSACMRCMSNSGWISTKNLRCWAGERGAGRCTTICRRTAGRRGIRRVSLSRRPQASCTGSAAAASRRSVLCKRRAKAPSTAPSSRAGRAQPAWADGFDALIGARRAAAAIKQLCTEIWRARFRCAGARLP